MSWHTLAKIKLWRQLLCQKYQTMYVVLTDKCHELMFDIDTKCNAKKAI